ncbi:MAG: tyrosine-type recombinase/integrase [Oscillospiraceae bacterium]|nr:tyrosine-type recombinase/integrase [Oscillospiraceae bacterium]
MASIQRIDGKTGVSFKITVTNGVDITGKQVRHFRTWRPEHSMTERQMQKAVQKAALDFEREIEQGYAVDERQTFAQYAEYVLSLKERTGTKHKTVYEYRRLTERLYPAIGHIKLSDLRPQHLNSLYKSLSATGVRKDGQKATSKINLQEEMKHRNLSRAKLAAMAGISSSTASAACRGCSITRCKAEKIAEALKLPFAKVFTSTQNDTPLSTSTLLAYHRFIHTVLDQAEKEMLVPYNAAAKATPPKLQRKEVNYFQPEQVSAILNALKSEPLKWHLIVHLLIVTGCRRGEILGLKWSKVDFTTDRIRVDTALLYSKVKGIYEGPTKTGNVRSLGLPSETIELLKEYRKQYFELKLLNGDRWNDTDYIFVRDDGNPVHPDSLAHWLRGFSKRHSLPHINAHAFRHTVASVLIANGTDVVTVSKQLGHLDVSTTENYYAHIIEEHKQKATECIADTLLRQKRA